MKEKMERGELSELKMEAKEYGYKISKASPAKKGKTKKSTKAKSSSKTKTPNRKK